MKLLVRVTQVEAKRPRWTPEAHRTWIKKVFGKKVFPSSDERLAAARGGSKTDLSPSLGSNRQDRGLTA